MSETTVRKRRRPSAPPQLTDPKTRPTGRYAHRHKDDLLATILGETAQEAADQERELKQEFERRRERRAAREQEAERERFEQIQAAMERERERRQEAARRRERVLAECREEELRLSGEWSALSSSSDSAPDTEELAALASHPGPSPYESAYSPIEAPPSLLGSPGRKVGLAATMAGLFAIVLVAMGAGPELDPAAYPKVQVAISPPTVASTTVAFREIERPQRRSRPSRDDRPTDPHHSSTGQPSDEIGAGTEPSTTVLNLTLDNAEDLWQRGSEWSPADPRDEPRRQPR